jgi:hypothetical protein
MYEKDKEKMTGNFNLVHNFFLQVAFVCYYVPKYLMYYISIWFINFV